MTSKERVLAALERKRGDRLPFYIMGFYEAESQEKIQKYLDVGNLEKVYEKLGVDVRFAGGLTMTGNGRLCHCEERSGPERSRRKQSQSLNSFTKFP